MSRPLDLAQLLQESSPVIGLANAFQDHGLELYLVGGSVRDAWLKRPHEDLDFATDAPPEVTKKIVRPLASSVWLQGEAYGTVGVEISGLRMEITTFRTETYKPASRHPDVRFASNIETDLSRRDFTINAMAVRLPDKQAVDPFGGVKDLSARLIKTPLDPIVSFTDDPLRMLRAFRFASQLDLQIEGSVLAAIGELRDEIKTVSFERIRDELAKLITGLAPGRALALAEEVGLTQHFLPELSSLKLEQDPVQKHKDVFHHTLAVVERTEPILELRFAA
ncbi:MAG: CCA tRNA nucleotidyltransferase, partial [Actinobacteria bacterium]|nr:CCA tRNA nucleotidyltransferase [Actinomycetota bacterium]